MPELPQKESYKLSEVCQYTDTQPYVLRFWESEFPQLTPDHGPSGQPIYRKEDVQLVQRIKELLYEEEYTLAGARDKLQKELKGGGKPQLKATPHRRERPAKSPREAKAQAAPARQPAQAVLPVSPRGEHTPAQVTPTRDDAVPRSRYDDALDEIDHLRMQLREADKRVRRAETTAQEAEQQAETRTGGAARAAGRIQSLIERLEQPG